MTEAYVLQPGALSMDVIDIAKKDTVLNTIASLRPYRTRITPRDTDCLRGRWRGWCR